MGNFMQQMTPLIKKALCFAAEKHDGQYRKGGRVPYIVHPVQVAFGVSTYTNNEEVIAAAFLHDVLEDCSNVSVDLLREEFGNKVTQIVYEMSLDKYVEYKNWKEKKKLYLAKINEASEEALVIVAVDKMSNLRAYFDALRNKGANEIARYFGGTPNEYRWYYEEIGNILVSTLGEHPVAKDYMEAWRSHQKNR